jgi:hypothetical protein
VNTWRESGIPALKQSISTPGTQRRTLHGRSRGAVETMPRRRGSLPFRQDVEGEEFLGFRDFMGILSSLIGVQFIYSI